MCTHRNDKSGPGNVSHINHIPVDAWELEKRKLTIKLILGKVTVAGFVLIILSFPL